MVLVDNNLLSSLAKIERLGLLDGVFDEIQTTTSVLDELHRDTVAGYEFVDRVDAVKQYEGGWLEIVAPTADEPELTEAVLDHSLSYTDAELIAIAEHRSLRLLTDDRHVGTAAAQRDVETWDLTLLVRAACDRDVIDSADELRTVMITSSIQTSSGSTRGQKPVRSANSLTTSFSGGPVSVSRRPVRCVARWNTTLRSSGTDRTAATDGEQ